VVGKICLWIFLSIKQNESLEEKIHYLRKCLVILENETNKDWLMQLKRAFILC